MINLDDIDITQTPPTHEPERQYYYMAKARQYVKKKSEELGRPLTLFLKTFGWNIYRIEHGVQISSGQRGKTATIYIKGVALSYLLAYGFKLR